EVKNKLQSFESLEFQLPNGSLVPIHFHITEVGAITKDFIDCGGTVRHEKVVNFQLWEANDVDHRLAPQKLLSIILLAEKVLGLGDWEVEVEYQGETIGKFGLEAEGERFLLTSKSTTCLASDSCGIPKEKKKLSLAESTATGNCCTPGGGCC
ncbi:MAG: hypothetical protein K2Q22_06445, partial [Cytophagales bacterium]|nr:hypothetical protein [Cytophagales bacterium]